MGLVELWMGWMGLSVLLLRGVAGWDVGLLGWCWWMVDDEVDVRIGMHH
jgi:hypothetical protein